MNRASLEHLIRATAEITNEYDLVIIGSQSILGQFPNAPEELLVSMEADIFPRNYREKLSDIIDGSIGEGSPFHEHFGYYAQRVGPETAVLPPGWETRTIAVQNANTNLKTGHCLEVHDLACSKLVAGRPKDLTYVEVLCRNGMVDEKTFLERLQSMNRADSAELEAWVSSRFQAPKPMG